MINRYLGQFFEEKLSADQICIDLYNGKGCVYNVALCCEVKWWKSEKIAKLKSLKTNKNKQGVIEKLRQNKKYKPIFNEIGF